MIKTVTLKISKLSGKDCIQTLDNSIKRLPGVLSIALKNEEDRVYAEVSYESGKVSFEKIREAVMELGYPVTGYIIHEHSHSHGDVVHSHPHGHKGEGKNHTHPHDSQDPEEGTRKES